MKTNGGHKMKQLIAALTLLATITHAQIGPPLVHEIATDFQQLQELDDMGLQQGANVEYRVRLRVGGRWFPLAGLTAEWQGRENVTDAAALVAASVETVTNVTPNYFRFLLDSDQTGDAREDWTYSIVVKEPNRNYPLGEGRLDIQASAWSGAPSVLLAGAINWAQITGYTNTATHGPVRGDGTTISTETNIDGSITLTAMAAGVVWEAVTGKPFETLSELTTNNLTGIAWDDIGGASSWNELQDIPVEVSTMDQTVATTSSVAFAGVTTVGDVVAGGASLQGAAQLGGNNEFTGGTNSFELTGASRAIFQNLGGNDYGLFITGAVIGSIQALYGPSWIRFEGADIIMLNNNTLKQGRGIWRSEGTASNGTEIVNFETMETYVANNAGTDTNAVLEIVSRAAVTPHFIDAGGGSVIAEANKLTQAVTNIVGSTTISWPEFSVEKETTILLTIPPTAQNVILGNSDRIEYQFIFPLSSSQVTSTNEATSIVITSPYGRTTAFATVRGETAETQDVFVPTTLATDYGSDWDTLTNAIAGKQDAGDYAHPVYQPFTVVTPATNTVITVLPNQPIYTLELLNTTNNVSLAFDLDSLSITNQAATWEVWITTQSTNTPFALPPETNGVYYVSGESSHTFTSDTETLYTVWRAWVKGGVTNLWCNSWEAR
jgi:hypothetical protein